MYLSCYHFFLLPAQNFLVSLYTNLDIEVSLEN